MTFSVWKCQSPHLVLQQLWCDAMGCGAGTACRNGWYVWAPLSDDLSSLLIRQTSPNVWWILTPPSAPTGSWLLFAVLGTSSRPSSSSCCLKDESDLPSTTPPCPIFSPTPEATRRNWRSNSRLVVATSEEEEEKNWDTKKACSPLPSSRSRWSTTVSYLQPHHINPSKNLSLGNLHVWPGCSWSLGTLVAAVCSVGLSDGCSLLLCCMFMLAPGRGEEEGNIIWNGIKK